MIAKMLTVLAMASVTLSSSAANASDPEATLASFSASLAAGDKEKVLALLAPGVVIYESGYVESTRDEYASHHLMEDMKFAKSTTQKVLRQNIRIAGATAVLWQETETSGVADGKSVHSRGTTTAVLEKGSEGWVIVHLHWSSRKAK
jgi:ketosteroid isomerase-like protein